MSTNKFYRILSDLFLQHQIKLNLFLQAKTTDKGWTSRSRRRLIEFIIDEWVSGRRKRPTVRRLLAALSAPEFLDVKIKVESLLEENYDEVEINRIIDQLS